MADQELLTVGELAKEMNVTVRTLQYYDREGLLKPSNKSEGGRRLYTQKDVVKLHQILSLKYLRFSLEEIKNNLFQLNTPSEVAGILLKQKEIVQSQIAALVQALTAIDALYDEVIQMETVDFKKYADIIALLQLNNRDYWLIKLFDEELLDHVKNKYQDHPDYGAAFFERYKSILDESIALKEQDEPPQSARSIKLAEKWWTMISEFTGGDMSLLPKLMKFNDNKDGWDEELRDKQALIDEYIGEAMNCYFQQQGISIPGME
ncbi:Nodulation protein NolA [compost metagenome]